MGLTELFLIASVLINWWQWGEQAELETRLEQQAKIANACQEAQENAREIELESADERALVLANTRRVLSDSKQHIRYLAEDRRSDCDSMVSPGGSDRVEELIRLQQRINRQWLRAPGAPFDEDPAPGSTPQTRG